MNMNEIYTVEDIVSLAKKGCSEWDSFGYVDVKEKENLLLFSYKEEAQILGGQTTDAPILTVTEKLDGSLSILYRENGYRVATRGSIYLRCWMAKTLMS